jgi:hypothetical protein
MAENIFEHFRTMQALQEAVSAHHDDRHAMGLALQSITEDVGRSCLEQALVAMMHARDQGALDVIGTAQHGVCSCEDTRRWLVGICGSLTRCAMCLKAIHSENIESLEKCLEQCMPQQYLKPSLRRRHRRGEFQWEGKPWKKQFQIEAGLVLLALQPLREDAFILKEADAISNSAPDPDQLAVRVANALCKVNEVKLLAEESRHRVDYILRSDPMPIGWVDAVDKVLEEFQGSPPPSLVVAITNSLVAHTTSVIDEMSFSAALAFATRQGTLAQLVPLLLSRRKSWELKILQAHLACVVDLHVHGSKRRPFSESKSCNISLRWARLVCSKLAQAKVWPHFHVQNLSLDHKLQKNWIRCAGLLAAGPIVVRTDLVNRSGAWEDLKAIQWVDGDPAVDGPIGLGEAFEVEAMLSVALATDNVAALHGMVGAAEMFLSPSRPELQALVDDAMLRLEQHCLYIEDLCAQQFEHRIVGTEFAGQQPHLSLQHQVVDLLKKHGYSQEFEHLLSVTWVSPPNGVGLLALLLQLRDHGALVAWRDSLRVERWLLQPRQVEEPKKFHAQLVNAWKQDDSDQTLSEVDFFIFFLEFLKGGESNIESAKRQFELDFSEGLDFSESSWWAGEAPCVPYQTMRDIKQKYHGAYQTMREILLQATLQFVVAFTKNPFVWTLKDKTSVAMPPIVSLSVAVDSLRHEAMTAHEDLRAAWCIGCECLESRCMAAEDIRQRNLNRSNAELMTFRETFGDAVPLSPCDIECYVRDLITVRKQTLLRECSEELCRQWRVHQKSFLPELPEWSWPDDFPRFLLCLAIIARGASDLLSDMEQDPGNRQFFELGRVSLFMKEVQKWYEIDISSRSFNIRVQDLDTGGSWMEPHFLCASMKPGASLWEALQVLQTEVCLRSCIERFSPHQVLLTDIGLEIVEPLLSSPFVSQWLLSFASNAQEMRSPAAAGAVPVFFCPPLTEEMELLHFWDLCKAFPLSKARMAISVNELIGLRNGLTLVKCSQVVNDFLRSIDVATGYRSWIMVSRQAQLLINAERQMTVAASVIECLAANNSNVTTMHLEYTRLLQQIADLVEEPCVELEALRYEVLLLKISPLNNYEKILRFSSELDCDLPKVQSLLDRIKSPQRLRILCREVQLTRGEWLVEHFEEILAEVTTAQKAGHAERLRGAILRAEGLGIPPDSKVIREAKIAHFDLACKPQKVLDRPPPVRWQYEVSSAWLDFTQESAAKLESCHCMHVANPQESSLVSLVAGRVTYEVCVQTMQQRNTRTGRIRCVRRLEPADTFLPFALPGDWSEDTKLLVDITPKQATRMEELLKGTAHNDEQRFPGSRCLHLRGVHVKRVLRIQNQELWQLFCLKRRSIRNSIQTSGQLLPPLHPPSPVALWLEDSNAAINETFAFHGTTYEIAMKIAEEGFDERLSGGLYGYGLYFTPQSCKAEQYAPENAEGKRYIIIARVVLGRISYAQASNSNQRVPPDSSDGLKAHCLVANPGEMVGAPRGEQHHQELVIFDGEQAYPEYLVEFTI